MRHAVVLGVSLMVVIHSLCCARFQAVKKNQNMTSVALRGDDSAGILVE